MIEQNVYIHVFIYCSLIFIYFQTGMSENETIHITMMKNWVSQILFLRKRQLIVYLAALKKGAIRAAQSVLSYIGSYLYNKLGMVV